MNYINRSYLGNIFMQNAIIAFFICISIVTLLFYGKSMPVIWIAFASMEVILFYYFANSFSKNWRFISKKRFRQNIFTYSVIIRLVWVVFSYFFFQYHTGDEFEFNAA